MDSTVIEEAVAKTLQTASLLVLKCLQTNYCDVAGVTLGCWAAGEGTPQNTHGMPCEGIPKGMRAAMLLAILPTPPPQHWACAFLYRKFYTCR